ncbi:MAG TPA: YiiX/YebB-like N1pC/P60 family cysteine hydrolase [Nannocystaceae bacterium]|nr:YiiX/YebB-like N1pC/P60 family cysteine hydrolase [Nannocystaceae bacterium]
MTPSQQRSARRWRIAALAFGVAFVLWAPEPNGAVPQRPASRAFAWNADALFTALERRHADAKAAGCNATFDGLVREVGAQLDALASGRAGPDDPRWEALERSVFELFAEGGGCPDRIDELAALRSRLRAIVKHASRAWERGQASRDRVYRLLYGSRAALEELLLQLRPDDAPRLSFGTDVRSATPSLVIEGVRVHSGDILLSRGGAPTSAFIARGNDYPGNFSHVALVHVAEDGAGSVIEAHIERGVAVTDAAGYLADKKLRIAVLRLRADHPAVVEDPLLPHRAAATALTDARARHIPYDFAMDTRDHTEQFCSEVAAAGYAAHGVVLWDQLSTFSSGGLARWMASLGVRHLETQAPADLEYDPQLDVVAEWHDARTLLDDHIDNAAIDAMLEQAEAGAVLDHDWRLLGLARMLKLYSSVKVLFGSEGPIPEGMTATIALRAQWLSERHGAIRENLREQIAKLQTSEGRTPPYWELVTMARAAAR